MKKLTMLITLTLLASCSPKKSGVKANIGATATISGVATGIQCVSNNNSTSKTGYIYDNSANSYNFENQVKGLLSATINPSEVGTISAQAQGTGVGFSGSVKLDSAGNVVGAQSKVIITIHDSIWYMNQIPDNLIELKFDQIMAANGATISGQFNTQTGDGFLSLKDKYGEVRFDGKIDAQKFSGIVKFQNSTTVIGGSPVSGTLGQFEIQRCAILQ